MIKTGQFTGNTGTPNYTQSVTGVGFQPKAIIFWSTDSLASGSTLGTGVRGSFGFADGTNGFVMAVAEDDAAGTANNAKGFTNEAMRLFSAATPTTDAIFTVTTLGTDGFTVTWSDSPAAATSIIHWMAFGGNLLTNVISKQFTMTTGAGNKAYTGVGFQPDFAIFITQCQTTLGTSVSLSFSLGMAKSSSNRYAYHASSTDGVAANNPKKSMVANDRCMLNLDTSGVIRLACDFVSFDSDGFTINQITNSVSTPIFAGLFFKGGNYILGDSTRPTASTNEQKTFSISGVTNPNGMLLLNPNITAFSNATISAGYSFGIGTYGVNGGDRAMAQCCREVDASDANRGMKTSRIYAQVSITAANPTSLEVEGVLDSLTKDDFKITFNPNITSGNTIFMYVVFDTGTEQPIRMRLGAVQGMINKPLFGRGW